MAPTTKSKKNTRETQSKVELQECIKRANTDLLHKRLGMFISTRAADISADLLCEYGDVCNTEMKLRLKQKYPMGNGDLIDEVLDKVAERLRSDAVQIRKSMLDENAKFEEEIAKEKDRIKKMEEGL